MSATAPDDSLPQGPTLVEIWAPWCSECRAMKPDVESAATRHAGEVTTVLIDAGVQPERARALKVRGTPTLIGFRDGEEVFRVTGRQSRGELEALYRSLISDGVPPTVGSVDRRLRSIAAIALTGLGLATGPSWPLVGAGAGIGLWVALNRGSGVR